MLRELDGFGKAPALVFYCEIQRNMGGRLRRAEACYDARTKVEHGKHKHTVYCFLVVIFYCRLLACTIQTPLLPRASPAQLSFPLAQAGAFGGQQVSEGHRSSLHSLREHR